MSKSILFFILVMGITATAFADNARNSPFPAKNLEKKSVKFGEKLPWEWRCFDVTYYLSCGYHWQGNVCVYTDKAFITDEQFRTGWNQKNYQLCGPNALPW